MWEETKYVYGSTAAICNVVNSKAYSPNRQNYRAPSKEQMELARNPNITLLPIQEVMVEGQNKSCNLLYDSGSNVNLIRHAYAKELGLSGSTVSQSLQVTGREPEQLQTVLYNIPLRRASGEIKNITAYGIPDITANLTPVNLAPIIIFFSGIRLKDIQRPTGKVDLLLGVHEARLFPKSLDSHDNLLLQTSVFGSGLVLSGYHPLIKSEGCAHHSRPRPCMSGVNLSSPGTPAPALCPQFPFLWEGYW